MSWYNLYMTVSESQSTVMHANPEHEGVRTTVFLVLILALVVGFFLIRALILWLGAGAMISEFAFAISCVGSIFLALGFAWVVETISKRRWHSGIDVTLNAEQVQLTRPYRISDNPNIPTGAQTLKWAERINITCWYFALNGYPRGGREKRMPTDWYCLAYELLQDNQRISVFSYLPPKQAHTWIDDQKLAEPFHKITPATLYGRSRRFSFGPPTRPEIPNEIITSKDGRFWLAERRRWQQGVELTPKDFEMLLQTVYKLTEPEIKK